MSVLANTNCLVIGPMEEDMEGGNSLRKRVKDNLSKININVWDHYSRPFIEEVEEDDATHELLDKYRRTGQYKKIAEYKNIRRQDLSLVDTADFIICVFERKTFSVGTWNEFFLADQLRKPIFFVWGAGKENCPFWIFWTLPDHFIYSSLEECLETIHQIDSGKIKIDNKRWRLKKHEYR